MKKLITIILLISLAIFLSGCGNTNSSTTTTVDPFIGGTNSIDLRFESDAPPSDVYAGDYPFDIVVIAKNMGEYDVSEDDLTIKLSGFDIAAFGLASEDIEKNSIDYLYATKKDPEGDKIEGTETSIEFTNLNYADDLDAAINNLPIRADACFKYGTKVRSKLCIKKDVLDKKDSDVCVINEDKKAFNSGAPIQVESFKEVAQGTTKIAFTFIIKHTGDGLVYKKDSSCNQEREFENRVWVNIQTDLEGLTCSGISPETDTTTGYVNLGDDGEKTVRCTMDVTDAPTDFEKPISIELLYDYHKDITTSLNVRPNQ